MTRRSPRGTLRRLRVRARRARLAASRRRRAILAAATRLGAPAARRRIGPTRQQALGAVLAFGLLTSFGGALAQIAAPLGGLERASLTLFNAKGDAFAFTVEVAVSPEEQARGLMFRETLADDEGMIFVYEKPEFVSFWMRNTLIPLDMLFIDGRGRIVRIHENAIPLDETAIPSGAPVQFVLEIAGGLSAKLGVKAGDRVSSPVIARMRLKASPQ